MGKKSDKVKTGARAGKDSRGGKRGKIKLPKEIGGLKLPKELRKSGEALIEAVRETAGRELLAAGMSALAAQAIRKASEPRAAPVPPEAPVPPGAPVPPEPPRRPAATVIIDDEPVRPASTGANDGPVRPEHIADAINAMANLALHRLMTRRPG